MKQLDRYLLHEMLGPTVFGLLAFAGLFAGSELVQAVNLALETGISAGLVVRLVALHIPQIIVWTTPMAVLLGVLLSLSRLSAGSEIVAMRAGGRSLARIALPVLCAAALISVATFLVGDRLVPWANLTYRRTMIVDVHGRQLPKSIDNVILQRYHGPGGTLSWFMYATHFDRPAGVLQKVTMVDLQNGRPIRTTYAQRVVWRDNAWYMQEGTIYMHGSTGGVTTVQFIDGEQEAPIRQTPENLVITKNRPEEMSARELWRHIEILKSQGADTKRLLVQWHQKFSLAAASFCFAFAAIPLAIQSHRSATSVGFGMAIAIILLYYLLMTLSMALGESGVLPPFLGAWGQNLVLLVVGGLLIRWKKWF